MACEARRRRFLRALAAGAAGGLAGCTGGTPTGSPRDDGTTDDPSGSGTSVDGAPPDAVALETVATGFRAPVDVAFAPAADRRYVAEQGGRILVHGPDGVREEPFLALGDAVTAGGEKGLLGIALHPDFATNRRAYVRYSAPRRSGTPPEYSHTFVLAAFTATDDGLRARPDSERTILEIPEPQGNHNAGDLRFGPTGLLYVAVGDGGAGGDQGTGHVADWYDAVDGGNGQDVAENLLGSVLRIDVDARDDGRPYGIPDDNPLVGEDGLDEHYAWGLRNPWRMSIDPAGSRVADGPDLYVGDVGQRRFEEVDLVRPGGNYGWNVREGTHCFDADECPAETPEGEPLLGPIVEYPHDVAAVSGVSVIGGHVYRGDAVPGLRGRYVFADWRADGRLFVASPASDGTWATDVLPVERPALVRQVRSFGRDRDGDLYVLAAGDSGWGLHRLTAA